jgi:DHA1 family multidrug resistance protein-like MFS transporter
MPVWQRNLVVISAAELVTVASITMVVSFLPFYVQDLGVTEPQEVALWSGLLITSRAVTTAIVAPIWGSLADRYSRKLMVERAIFGGAVILGAMGFVRNVQQLVILRAVQGCLTGTIPAATTLVASSMPRRRSGYALGLLQMAIYIGGSVGPLLGGAVADTLGHRAAFWMAAALLFLAGLTVLLLVEEHFEPMAQDSTGPSRGLWQGLGLVLHSGGLLAVFVVRVAVRLGDNIVRPVMPLFVQSLVPGAARVASLTGLVFGLKAGASAMGAVALGRASDRVGHRRILASCALCAMALYGVQFFVTAPLQLLVLQGASGLVMGGMVASISARLANLAPEGYQGVVYGLDTTAVSAANALGPMAGATIAAGLGLRPTFLCTAGIFGLAALGVIALGLKR